MKGFLYSLKLLPIFALLVGCNNSYQVSGQTLTGKLTFTSDIYGPFDGTANVSLSYSYSYSGNEIVDGANDNFSVYSINSDGSLTSKSSKNIATGKRIQNGYTFSTAYTLPNSKYLIKNGLVYRIGPYVKSKSAYFDYYEGRLYSILSETIDPFVYRRSPYEIKDRFICLSKDVDTTESYLFSDYSDFIEIDEYSRLRFDNLRFKYSFCKSFTYKQAYISFIDSLNLFPTIKKDSTGNTVIDMDLVYEDGYVYPIAKDYYVNPYTLVSNKTGEGEKSDYVYVPRGKGNNVEGYKFSLNIINMGYNNTSIFPTFDCIASSYFLSSSPTSRFGVVGGIKI